MAIRLIQFVAGAVVGSLATYLYRDEKLRKEIRQGADKLTHTVKDTASDVSDKVAEGFGQLRDKVSGKGAEEAPEPAKKASAKKAKKKVAKKTAVKKKTSKKKATVKTATSKTSGAD